ncbi:MAG: DUF4174 domain-containing protein [Phormidesmis sp. CAN_BIN36]|nr:DUF4174 domain-containing protein [Phormidesmis sp. CAN_BIN36]
MTNDLSGSSTPIAASEANGTAPVQSEVAFNLSDQQWQHRVLVVFAPSQQALVHQQQHRAWQSHTEAMRERDLKLVEVLATGASRVDGQLMSAASADRLRNQFGIAPEAFAIVLIGKDGTEKQRFDQPVDPRGIFSTINAMPMRQQEML